MKNKNKVFILVRCSPSFETYQVYNVIVDLDLFCLAYRPNAQIPLLNQVSSWFPDFSDQKFDASFEFKVDIGQPKNEQGQVIKNPVFDS